MASRMGGALTIYKQFLKYLPIYSENHSFYLFIDPIMDHPFIPGVTYVMESNHSWKRRMWWDYIGLRKWCISRKIKVDLLVSFQNTGVRLNCPQLIYYHQSLPFYSNKWNLLIANERKMFFYKHIYPYYVNLTLTSKTHIVVQIPYIKEGFIHRFKINPQNVHVFFPDIPPIDEGSIEYAQWDSQYYHFLYPATAAPYKSHMSIVKALVYIKKQDRLILDKIRVHFTINKNEREDLLSFICSEGLEKNFIFEGKVSYDTLLTYYKSAVALLYPSTIETLGLPLLEAASLGLPIVASDLHYAHEVLGTYSGVKYYSSEDYKGWSEGIRHICGDSERFMKLKARESSWPLFYGLIFKLASKYKY